MEDFALRDAPMPSPGAGQVLLRHLYLSLDPAIRGWMSEARSYLPPIAIGAPVRSGTLSEVVESNLPSRSSSFWKGARRLFTHQDEVPSTIAQVLTAPAVVRATGA